MPEHTPAIRVASIPWGVIGFFGLVLVVEAWVSRHDLDLANKGAVAHAYARGAVAKAVGAEILIMGDSLAKFGLLPRVIEGRTGGRTYNLAVPSATPPMTYYLLKRVLDRGGRPRVVVVDFKPTQLQTDPTRQVDDYATALRLPECLDMAWSEKSPLLFAAHLTRRTLPSLLHRAGIRRFIVGSLGGRPSSQAPANLTALRNWNVNSGGGLMPKNPMIESPAPYWDEAFYFECGAFRCQAVNAEYIRRFLTLASSHQIPVYWVVPPISPRVQASRDHYRHDDRYTVMLKRALERWPGLTVVDGRHAGYPARVFSDGAHLDLEGAYTFTDTIGGLIRLGTPAPGSRYVDLPPYRDRPIPPGFEDEEVSRYVLFGGPRPVDPVFATLPGSVRR